jgi:hypothetical protein
MNERFFTGREWKLLALLVVLATAFTVGQKHFIPAAIRPFTYGAFVLALFVTFFRLTKPERPMEKARRLALVVGGIALFLVVLLHVVIRFDPTYKNAIVVAGAVAGPFVAAWIHQLVGLRRGRA